MKEAMLCKGRTGKKILFIELGYICGSIIF